MPLRLSVLDLSPVPAGETGADALRHTLDLARLADRLGYRRYWLAEHHNTTGVASSSPEILIGHVAQATERIRVGSGGVMLPNHAPLKVAESFRVLEALHPGRIDLGIGRAPGTDGRAALALRRSEHALWADDFPEQLDELLAYLSDDPASPVVAVPTGVPAPPVWLLGSSDFGARVAAALGLGVAFAHHINPAFAVPMLRLYRESFRPSESLAEPRALLATAVVCAESDDEAGRLASSLELSWLRLAQGRPGPLPRVEEALAYPYSEAERERLAANRARLTVGAPATVRRRLEALAADAGVDEVMVVTAIHDHAARRRSYELLAEAFALSQPAAARPDA